MQLPLGCWVVQYRLSIRNSSLNQISRYLVHPWHPIQFNSIHQFIRTHWSHTKWYTHKYWHKEKNQFICSREYVILRRDHAVHINSTIISISFLSKFGIAHCCSLILSSDDNKAAWPLSSSVRSLFQPVFYQNTFDSLTSVNYRNKHWEPTY